MLKLLTLFLCTSLVAGIPFLCRKRGETPDQIGTCGWEKTALHQGSCLCCFNNTADLPTIGFGFSLVRSDAAEKMAQFNLSLEDVLMDCRLRTRRSCITDEDALQLYQEVTYPEVAAQADEYVRYLPQLAKSAVADILLSGEGDLHDDSNFPEFRTNLENRNYTGAAAALYETRWCKTVQPERCEDDVKCIASLCPNGYVCKGKRSSCSTNSNCLCLKTDEGISVCGPNFYCSEYPGCVECPERTHMCSVRGCCGPKCIPLSVLDKCPPANISMDLTRNTFLPEPTKQSCFQDSECPLGKKCDFHFAGKFCR